MMGVLSGFAGIVQSALSRNFNPTLFIGQNLDVLASVILGGAAIKGGRGTVIGLSWVSSCPDHPQSACPDSYPLRMAEVCCGHHPDHLHGNPRIDEKRRKNQGGHGSC